MGSSKNVLITVVICVGILIAWQYIQHYVNPPKPQPKQAKSAAAKTGAGETKGAKTAETKDAPEAEPKAGGKPTQAEKVTGAKTGPRSSTVEGKKARVKAGKVATGAFTSNGGALRHWVLQHPRYKLMRDGKLEQVDLVFTRKGEGPWPLATKFKVEEGDEGISLPANAEYSLTKRTTTQVSYTYKDAQVQVDKLYTVKKSGTLIDFKLKVKNLSDRRLSQRLLLSLYNYHDPTLAKPAMTNPYPRIPTVTCHDGMEIQRRSRDSIKGTDSNCSAGSCGMGEGEFSSNSGTVWWIGSGDRYFLTSVVPQDSDPKYCDLNLVRSKENVIQSTLKYKRFRLAPGKEKSWKFSIYLGAKELSVLDAVKGPTKDGDIGLNQAIDFGWFMMLCRPMLWLLKKFHSVFGNWGIAIILLTLVVKLLTLYWTQKSMRSMKKMTHLKPQIDLLREKYGDDKNRLNQEMMSLYKVHKVNPLGGCLPMLIQMPIWFALYRTLGNSVELYRSPFFGWISDLTAPDPYYVLPIAMGIAMYGQQAITPQPMEGTQAKMMKYFMPGFFTFMMLFLPSGLTLYIFVNTVLTMAHQYYMNKTDPDKDLAANIKKQAEAAKAASSKPPARTRARKARRQDEMAPEPGQQPRKTKGKAKKKRRKKKK